RRGGALPISAGEHDLVDRRGGRRPVLHDDVERGATVLVGPANGEGRGSRTTQRREQVRDGLAGERRRQDALRRRRTAALRRDRVRRREEIAARIAQER